MKKIITMMMVVAVAGVAVADLAIDLKNNSGLVYQPGTTTFVDRVLVQLIWAPTLNGIAQTDGGLDAGEFLLNSLVTTSGFAGTFSDQPQGILVYESADVGNANIQNGYFFVRLFDDAGVANGDFYLQQAVFGPDLLEYDYMLISTIYGTNATIDGGQLDAQGLTVIPEPATLSLMGIAGLGMFLARRKVRR